MVDGFLDHAFLFELYELLQETQYSRHILLVEDILESHDIRNLELILLFLGLDFVLIVFVKIVLLGLTQADIRFVQFVPVEGLFVHVEDTDLNKFDEKGELVQLLLELEARVDLLVLLLLLDQLGELRIILHVKELSYILGEQILTIGPHQTHPFKDCHKQQRKFFEEEGVGQDRLVIREEPLEESLLKVVSLLIGPLFGELLRLHHLDQLCDEPKFDLLLLRLIYLV